MEPYAQLDAAGGEFAKRLRAVRPDQWSVATPCGKWDVRALVSHVVAGNRMAAILARGGSRDEALAPFGDADVLGSNPVEAFNGSFRVMVDTFKKPGALDRVVHHPAGDIPGQLLFGFRVGDNALHAWDLARAIGADESLHEGLVADLWAQLSPMKDMIAGTGMFGAGPSGEVGDDAPLQARLLDLTGRRP